jgi:hypothetical protein
MGARHPRWIFAPSIAAAVLAASAIPARADAIDGDWCRGPQNFTIDGPRIVTPGRNEVLGDYGRYRFTYIAPAGEPDAGGDIKMVMIRGQETVHLTRPGASGPPEIWIRCKPIS